MGNAVCGCQWNGKGTVETGRATPGSSTDAAKILVGRSMRNMHPPRSESCDFIKGWKLEKERI